VQLAHVRGVGRVLRRAVGDAGERLHVDQRGDQRGAAPRHLPDELVGQPGAVLDAVDPGADQAWKRVGAEHVRGHPGAGGVRGLDGGHEHVVGPERREVAHAAVDPVAD
jgi:hypothetical protein